MVLTFISPSQCYVTAQGDKAKKRPKEGEDKTFTQ